MKIVGGLKLRESTSEEKMEVVKTYLQGKWSLGISHMQPAIVGCHDMMAMHLLYVLKHPKPIVSPPNIDEVYKNIANSDFAKERARQLRIALGFEKE